MSGDRGRVTFAADRISALLNRLERLAGGDTGARLDISPLHDELDAIAFGINVVADELRWAHRQMTEAERQRADALHRSKEAAERANESKSVLLRNASHEIRTPIAIITIITELLSLPELSGDERADLVAKLRANSEALLMLVGNLLDLSRLEAGKLTLMIEPVSPFELVKDVVESLEPQARKKGLDVHVDVDGRVPLAIGTDAQRLRQILVNVVGNALKFTESGSVRLTMSTASSPSGDRLQIDMADTGPGITPDGQRYLFEPFEQADDLTRRVHGGTGLGLTIARRLAEQLGGSLTLLHSSPGQGSTFRLTIGARAADRAESDLGAVRDRRSRPLPGVRILLAEDSADLRAALRRLLQSLGAAVDCANDGRDAIAKALSSSYDVVLMDIRMPEVNGIEAIHAIRASGRDVPIVALTGDAAAARRLANLDAGHNAVLSKPFDADHLVASIDAALKRRRETVQSSGGKV